MASAATGWGLFTRATSGFRLVQTNPGKTEKDTDIDIVAIHGLDAHSPDTWTWKDPENKGNKGRWVNWLEHPEMLQQDVSKARIFTLDWPADLYQPSSLVLKRVDECAQRLLEALQQRPLVRSRAGRNQDDRPLLFIASCLGGIVLMETLVRANKTAPRVRRATKGIVFLATPFHGTSFLDVAPVAEPAMRLWSWFKNEQANQTMLDAGTKDPTAAVRQLVRDFTQLCCDRTFPYRVAIFYEKGKTMLPRKVFPFLPEGLSDAKELVDEASASLDIVPDPVALDRPHVLMNKFAGPDCGDYAAVAGKIETMVTKICVPTLAEQAYDAIFREHYPGELTIQRLSGDELDMDNCYTNLEIVAQGDGYAGKRGETVEMSYERRTEPPFLIRRRLYGGTETYDKGDLVQLPELFAERCAPDGTTTTPRRILIRGRAGVGKTTLCKKMVHGFLGGSWTLFRRVLWVPLRRLKMLHDQRCSFADLLHLVFLSTHDNGIELARALSADIKNHRVDEFWGQSTLFILDGLDEVVEMLDRDHPKFKLLDKLLNGPNVIITTRPHVVYRGRTALDLVLETVGFTEEQVVVYLKAVMRDEETILRVRTFLHDHDLLNDLVRTPIILDAFCLIWDERRGKQKLYDTMTAFYREIVRHLWNKDIQRVEDASRTDARRLLEAETEQRIHPAMTHLGRLALSGLCSDLIEFQPAHRNLLSTLLPPAESYWTLDQAAQRLSFLRTSDSTNKQQQASYHFMHLTFQEYFAAHYFAQQWMHGQALQYVIFETGSLRTAFPKDFLGRFKYDGQYEMFWGFVVGLLDAREDVSPAPVLGFFSALENEARDVLSPGHNRLVNELLDEVAHKKGGLPFRTHVLVKLREPGPPIDQLVHYAEAVKTHAPGPSTLMDSNDATAAHAMTTSINYENSFDLTDLSSHESLAKAIRLDHLETKRMLSEKDALGLTLLLRYPMFIRNKKWPGRRHHPMIRSIAKRAGSVLEAHGDLPEAAILDLIDLFWNANQAMIERCRSTSGGLRESVLDDECIYWPSAILRGAETLPDVAISKLKRLSEMGCGVSLYVLAGHLESSTAMSTISALLGDENDDIRSSVCCLVFNARCEYRFREGDEHTLSVEQHASSLTICNLPFTESWYGVWLLLALVSRFTLHVVESSSEVGADGAGGHRECILTQGGRAVVRSLDDDGYRKFREAVERGRELWVELLSRRGMADTRELRF